MHIALDARTVYSDQRRGTGRNLIDLYRELAVIRPNWQVTAYYRSGQHASAVLPSATPVKIEMPGDRVDAWQRWRLPMAAWRAGATLLHCPANECPTWMPIPTVVTIHDLIPLDMPRGVDPLRLRRFEQSLRCACRNAAHIITPSQYTRDRLINEYGADAECVTVNHWAPDRTILARSDDGDDQVLARYGIERPFVLHLGAAEARKNTQRVIEAWSTLRPILRRQWSLLIVGLDESARLKMQAVATELDCLDSVRVCGFAGNADLAALFSAAQVLAYPSLAEGFGLPILDAWVTDTAVLTSDSTSLPEVAADAAVLVDPAQVIAISQAMSQMISDDTLRDRLIAAGRTRVGRFTWRATAERFAAALESAAGESTAVRRAA